MSAPALLSRCSPPLRARRLRRRAGRAAAPRRPAARRCAPPGSTPTATAPSSPAPGEPLRDRTDLAPARAPGPHAGHARGRSPTPTSATRSRRRACRSSTASAARSPRPSARRRRCPRRCSTPRVRALDAARPDAVLVTGDLIDTAQANELALALRRVLAAASRRPDSGAPGYHGVQEATDPDPAYYRPDVDAAAPPRAARRGRSARSAPPGCARRGTRLPGNHDLLVAGEVAAHAGDSTRWPPATACSSSPSPRLLDVAAPRGRARRRRSSTACCAGGLPGRTRRVAPDPAARAATPAQAVAAPARASGRRGAAARMDYAFDAGPRRARHRARHDRPRRRRRTGVRHARAGRAGCARELRAAGDRWVVVVSHQPLRRSRRRAPALALLDRDPHVVAALTGDTHHNRIVARRTAAGGYWLIEHLLAGRLAPAGRACCGSARPPAAAPCSRPGWSTPRPTALADVARELAFLDAQGGRPQRRPRHALDRNVRLFHAPPR